MKTRSRQTVRFFNPPGLPVQAVRGVNVANDFRRHVHDKFCIGIVEEGARVICQGATSTIIPENAIFVINPGAVHACKPQEEEHSYFIVCVDAAYMKAIASQISGKACTVPYFKNILVLDTELGAGMRRFLSLVENPGSALATESVLISFLSRLILRHGHESSGACNAGVHAGAIQNVCQYIRTHYAQDLSLSRLSSVACLSPFYFQRLFLKTTGMSPHDYLIQVRIKKARDLLSQGHDIVDVALDTGFVDQSHFTRSFKRAMGITPGSYISGVTRISRRLTLR